MRYNFAVLSAVSLLVCLASANRAEAGGTGRSTRIDDENGAGCMSTYTTDVSNSASFNFTPGGVYLNQTACTPNSAAIPVPTSVLFPDGTFNGASGGSAASPFIATGGAMYQYFTGAITTGSTNNIPDAQVSVWDLKNLDTEVELTGWCPGGSGASFKFGGNTFAGGCSAGSAEDLLFNFAGSVVGFVTYTNGDPSTAAVDLSLKDLTGWTENGTAIGGSGTVGAPEIDASSAVAAMTLLFGGLAVLRGGRRSLVRFRR
jgi:hypothetical protein